jgi:hypothetical protein
MKEIEQQTALPTLLSLLKLYSCVGLDKLVTLLDNKLNTQTLRYDLIYFSTF